MKYFSYSEFDSPDAQGSGQMMDKTLLKMLDDVRYKFNKPMHITSGYRTIEHNKAIGGVKGSSHIKGLAVDIACTNSKDRFDLINCLLDVGFSRIGIAKTFIHVDLDSDKVQDVIWTY